MPVYVQTVDPDGPAATAGVKVCIFNLASCFRCCCCMFVVVVVVVVVCLWLLKFRVGVVT